MLEGILAIFTSGGFGAITGLVGGYLQKREERKHAEMQFQHEKDMGNLSIQELQIEAKQQLDLADKQVELAEAEGEIVIQSKEADAFVASQEQSNKPRGTMIDGIRSLTRVFITFFLLYLMWDLYDGVHTLIGGLEALGEAALLILYSAVIDEILFLTTTAVAWWFASRGRTK